MYAVKSGNRQHVQNTKDAIVARKDFKTSGALRGENFGDRYEVFSYWAVIAYWTEEDGWVLNSRRYSVTTGMHQSVVRAALALAGVASRVEEWK